MNINLTLIGQSLAFLVFVWFCMKFIWPLIINALEERKKNIADGLAAAEQGRKAKELAELENQEELKKVKAQAQDILASAEKRGSEIVDKAKGDAKTEGERIIASAQAEIEQEVNRARESLRGEVAVLAAAGAGQILDKEIDASAHNKMLDELAAQL